MTHQNEIILKPHISAARIQKRLKSLTREIVKSLDKNDLIIVGLLKGSFMFMADMVRLLHQHHIPLIIDFMSVSSYGSGTKPSGAIKLNQDITTNIQNRQVLVIDDILDTGQTMQFIHHHLSEMKPAKIQTCVFLDKAACRQVPFEADWVGFTVPEKFVVGYGLDYNHRFRELPYISVLEFKEQTNTKKKAM